MQSFFNKINIFEVRINLEDCSQCKRCIRDCPTFSLDEGSLQSGKALMSCTRCGQCVDECPKAAISYHIKGTPIGVSANTARLLFLYPAIFFFSLVGAGVMTVRTVADSQVDHDWQLHLSPRCACRRRYGNMLKLKSILGYSAAALSILVMLATLGVFVMSDLPESFLSATGLVTSPNYSGGEVVRTIDHGAYRTAIHRPVFDALIGERKEGFIQVAWGPAGALPARIDEEIDVDADGQADVRVELETATRQATLTPYSPNVIDLEGVYRMEEGLAIRINLKNPRKTVRYVHKIFTRFL